MTWQVYTADAFRMTAGNTSRFAGGEYLQKRYADILNPPKAETRTGEEIKAHMKAVLGRLEVSGNEPI